MINKLEINGVHLDVDAKLKAYITKKIGKLDRYMSRQVRESVHVEVFLKERTVKGKKDCQCEVVMHLPHDTITIKEATVNMFAAVDIVEVKLKNQLKKYKDMHGSRGLKRAILKRIKHDPAR